MFPPFEEKDEGDLICSVYDPSEEQEERTASDYPEYEKPIRKALGLNESLQKSSFDQDFPVSEHNALQEAAAELHAKVGDKIRIISLADEDESYFGKEGVIDHIDDLGQLHGTWGGLAIIPESDKFEIISESLTEAKEEGDKEVSYNKALAVAKSKNKPVIYGYSNKSYDGKFFELKDPIVCDSVFDETKKFKAQYKSCGTVYVAYPNRSFAEGLKLTEGADDKPERFTPEEQAEYNCDEDGNSLEGFDTLHHCAWCGDVETAGEMKHELNFGWLCSRCVADLKSRGETLTVVESVEDDVEHDEDYERSWGPEKVECSKCHTQANKDECRQADDGSWICAECDESLKESDKQPEEEIRTGLPSSNINFIRTDGKKAVIYYKDGNIEKIDAERRPDEEK